MSKFDSTQLSQFIGTECYWRISPSAVLTDGAKYVADSAGAYWLMDAIASYLPQFTGKQDFIVAKLVRTGSAAQLTLDDGNGHVLDQQHIEYTDFPMTNIQLYACWGCLVCKYMEETPMRLQEFISEEEWQRLEQLIYATTYKALAAYQQQRATQQRIATKSVATLKPQVAKNAKALARKVKQPPYAAPPKPLPKPKHVPQAKPVATQAFRPVKTVKPLPPSTRMAMAKARPQAPQPAPNKPAPQSITNPNAIDQAARRMLPKDKQGQNPLDLLSLDERG